MIAHLLWSCKATKMQLDQELTGLHFTCGGLLEVSREYPLICMFFLQCRYRLLTNEEPDEVRVVLGEKVIQIHEAGESAFIVFGHMPIHGYRLSVWCLKLRKSNVRSLPWHRNKTKRKTKQKNMWTTANKRQGDKVLHFKNVFETFFMH